MLRPPAPVPVKEERMKRGIILLAAAVLALYILPLFGLSRFEKSALEKKKKASDIVFLSHEPLQFGLRRGGVGANWPERYDKQQKVGPPDW